MRARAFGPSVRIPPTLTARPSLVDTRAVMSQAAATKTKKAPLGDVNSNAAPKDVAPAGSKKSVEQIYQKKTQLEHILLRPDTYVGSCEKTDSLGWVLDKATE